MFKNLCSVSFSIISHWLLSNVIVCVIPFKAGLQFDDRNQAQNADQFHFCLFSNQTYEFLKVIFPDVVVDKYALSYGTKF